MRDGSAPVEDPAVRVLLIEAGGHNREHARPYARRRRRADQGQEQAQLGLLDRARTASDNAACGGRAVGGWAAAPRSTALIYSRGHPRDYDRWAQSGLSGWWLG